MSDINLIFLAVLFIIKHFIVDFMMETPYQANNKHIFGHLGGILHSQLHAFASWIILGFAFGFVTPVVLVVTVSELFIHYFIDLCKTNLCIRYKWEDSTRKGFWNALGVDQALHYLTYVLMIYITLSNI